MTTRKGKTKHCAFGGCRSDSRYGDPVEFVPFPKACLAVRRRLIVADEEHLRQCCLCEKCERWIRLCRRKDRKFTVLNVNKHTYVCKNHFVDENGPSLLFPDPTTELKVFHLRCSRRQTGAETGCVPLRKPKSFEFVDVALPADERQIYNNKCGSTSAASTDFDLPISLAEPTEIKCEDQPVQTRSAIFKCDDTIMPKEEPSSEYKSETVDLPSLTNNDDTDSADEQKPSVVIKEEIAEEEEAEIFNVTAMLQNHHQMFQSSKPGLLNLKNTLNGIKSKEQWEHFLCCPENGKLCVDGTSSHGIGRLVKENDETFLLVPMKNVVFINK